MQSQSYTLASAPAGSSIEVRVVTSHGKLAGAPFKEPRVASGFGKGQPTEKSSSAGEYVFTVSGAGHYSVELFGQDDSGLRDALLIFLDDDTTPACPAPTGGGKLHGRLVQCCDGRRALDCDGV